MPAFESRPDEGFKPHTPQSCAGTRMLPPMSVPRPSGEAPAASSAPSPPLLPPGVRSVFHGFFARPKTWLTDSVISSD